MEHAETGERGTSGRRFAVAAVVGCVVLVASCAVQGPTFCETDRDCMGGRCDILSGTCVSVPDGRTDSVTCDPTACNSSCAASGFSAGSCAAGSCTCTNPPDAGTEDATTDDVGSDESASCDPAACASLCVDLGSESGRCEAGSCFCSGGPDADVPVDDGAVDEAPRDDGTVIDEATTPDETILPEDIVVDEASLPDETVADEATVVDEATAPEDTGPPTGPCGGPFSGSGDWGDSGWYCLADYTFRAIAGNTYTISTCASCSGDTYLVVSGACYCEDDDGCGGLCSECTCTATYNGDANICASTYGSSSATWSYTVSGVCRL